MFRSDSSVERFFNEVISLNITIPESNIAKKSAIGPASQTPVSPNNLGNIKNAGIKKIICLVKLINIAFFALPTA